FNQEVDPLRTTIVIVIAAFKILRIESNQRTAFLCGLNCCRQSARIVHDVKVSFTSDSRSLQLRRHAAERSIANPATCVPSTWKFSDSAVPQTRPPIKERSCLTSDIGAGPSPPAEQGFVGFIGPGNHMRAKHMNLVSCFDQSIRLFDQARIDRGLPRSHQAYL